MKLILSVDRKDKRKAVDLLEAAGGQGELPEPALRDYTKLQNYGNEE